MNKAYKGEICNIYQCTCTYSHIFICAPCTHSLPTGNKVKLFADDTDDTEPDEENDDVDIASHEKRQVVKVCM